MIGEEEKENEEEKVEKDENEISWKKWLLIMGIVTISLVAVFFVVVYFIFVYGSKKVVKETAEIYMNGDGSDLTDIQCPGYVSYFRENYKYLEIDSTNQNYIDIFRAETGGRIGELKSVDVDIDGIYTVDNLDELQEEFAQYGVVDVESYRQVVMTWEVSGGEGSISIPATAYVMKYGGEWYLDYITFGW